MIRRPRVIEFVPTADPSSLPLTEIGDGPTFDVRGAGMTLPAPVDLVSADLAPDGTHDRLERFEGMRVRIGFLTTVLPTLGSVSEPNATATSNGVFYGVLTGVERPFREPGIDVRQSLPAGAPCCVARFDGNPERLRVDSDGPPGAPAPATQTVLATRDVLDLKLVTLIDSTPNRDCYSYVFNGSAETLDHMLASPAMPPFVTRFQRVRGNADAPEAWRSDGSRPERTSDHDPAIIDIKVR